MDQRRLFRLAYEAINVSAWYEPGRGWSVSIVMRRGDQTWAEAERAAYERLDTAELVEVLDAHLTAQFGLWEVD